MQSKKDVVEVGDDVLWLWNNKVTFGKAAIIQSGVVSVEVGDKSYYKCAQVETLSKASESPLFWVGPGILKEKKKTKYFLYMWAGIRIPEELRHNVVGFINLKIRSQGWVSMTDEEIVELSNRYDVQIRGTTKKTDYPYLFLDTKGKRFSQR